MAYITVNKALFFVTSPRTPDKLIDEVRLLVENFSGQVWNSTTQAEYYLLLCKQDFFNGTASGDIAFKARDRINRSPKALGLVDLKPVIQMTDAGKEYLYGKRPHEAFTKQLIKYQLHSPFHIDKNEAINVRPYLEMIRLIHDLSGLTKTEIAIFGLQLINHNKYEEVKSQIISFREKTKNRDRNTSYNSYINSVFEHELKKIFAGDIHANQIATRENEQTSVQSFITTKKRNHNDYADALIRYLRATNLFTLNPFKNKISISPDKTADINYIYETINPLPIAYADEESYKTYLYDTSNVHLLTDNKELLINKIKTINKAAAHETAIIEQLKNIYEQLLSEKLEGIVNEEVQALQTYEPYGDVMDLYAKIVSKEINEPPLFLEWNTWRAFTMLNDGDIKGNFRIDDEGLPLYTAAGNVADIECHYTDFKVIVEVTMSSGQRQYEMEGEPVARHLGRLKKTTEQDVYCLFIAPTLSEATVAHYYTLHQVSVAQYGGKAKIIPLQLSIFEQMLRYAKAASKKPTSRDLKVFLDKASAHAHESEDENDWLNKVNAEALIAFK